jgi:hypothetical protein
LTQFNLVILEDAIDNVQSLEIQILNDLEEEENDENFQDFLIHESESKVSPYIEDLNGFSLHKSNAINKLLNKRNKTSTDRLHRVK